MNLWIITVNYGESSKTKSLIDSLCTLDNSKSIKVGIADNSSSSESLAELNQIVVNSKIDIRIFPNKKNLYYWPAAKKVIDSLKQTIGSYPDWVMVCNNDITFTDKNFIKILQEIDLIKFPIIGPNIINSKGKQLNPFMVFQNSNLKKLYWKLYFISYSFSLLMSTIKNFFSLFNLRSLSKIQPTNMDIYAVHGSAILFSNYFFNKGGYLDDNFEMYGEEITVAEIAKILSIPVTYFPQLKIIHHEHSTTEIIDNRLLYNKAKESYKYIKSVYNR